MKLKIGICGVGAFGSQFIKLFKKHPQVHEVVLADVSSERLAAMAKENAVSRTFNSLDELCKSDVDAIAIFTQRWLHGPQAIQALKAGKHVYSAVPCACSLEEISELVEAVKETGLIYMLGETSYYRPQTFYCRKRFAKGDFGKFVYGEAQYYHDMAHFYTAYLRTGGKDWKKVASFPPMLYPTHSTAFILSVTFRRMTEVSCFGFVDDHEDGIFRSDISEWKNIFSNESGMFRTSDGGIVRINEFRRVCAGEPRMSEDRMSILGTLGSYQELPGKSVWTHFETLSDFHKNGKIDYENIGKLLKIRNQDISDIHKHKDVEITEENLGDLPREYIGRKHIGLSNAQPVESLPREFVGIGTGHGGTHQFLVVDFVEACVTHKLPPNNIWLASRYNAPGIVAHKSSKLGGKLLKIPDFGMPPSDWKLMDPASALKE